MPKKLTYEFIKEQIEKEGYNLLSKEYINANTKLKIRCPKGHEYEVTYGKFYSGRKCPECNGGVRLTYSYIKKQIEDRGFFLISNTYKNIHTKLDIKCPEGHNYKATYNNFRENHGCSVCFNLNKKGNTNSNWKGGVTKKNIPLYDTYATQIEYAEEVRRNKDDNNILEVKCAYCGKWFVPTISNITNRSQFLKGKYPNENRLYCSDSCKRECPIYNQIKYPKGYKKASSREVQPELRQMVFERDDWTCQKCGSKKNLHCHHIEGIRWEPLESADIDRCITYCKKCHKEVHKIEECRAVDMKCNQQKKGVAM